MQSVVGVALLRHSRLLAFINNLRMAYYAKSIPCWQNLSKKFRETSLTQVNDVRRGNGQDTPKDVRKMAAVLRPGISRWVPTTSCNFQQDPLGNQWKILGRYTASKFLLFPVFA